MPFKDWAETEAADPLILPINGKQYRIPAMGHLDAIAIREDMQRTADTFALQRHYRAVAAGEPGELSEEDVARIEADPPQIGDDRFLEITLGPVLEEMRADNVPERAIIHAATIAQTDAFAGREQAQKFWETGPNPEALAKVIRAAVSASSTTSPATPRRARTSSTKRPASTASTSSRTPKTAPRSTSKTSSRSRG